MEPYAPFIGPDAAPVWQFKHTVDIQAPPAFAWVFWTDVRNWAVIDDDIETVQLEDADAFGAGVKGVTVASAGSVAHWEVAEVDAPGSARIRFPVPGAALDAHWTFARHRDGGCAITQELVLHGPRAAEYRAAVVAGMATGVPVGMRALAKAIDFAFSTHSG